MIRVHHVPVELAVLVAVTQPTTDHLSHQDEVGVEALDAYTQIKKGWFKKWAVVPLLGQGFMWWVGAGGMSSCGECCRWMAIEQ